MATLWSVVSSCKRMQSVAVSYLFVDVLYHLSECGFLELLQSGAVLQPTPAGEALHEEIISVYMHRKIGGYSSGNVCRKFC
jgi:hypothetical protein